MSFFDKYGNILPNNNQPTSENPSTFNAAYFFSKVARGIEMDNRIEAIKFKSKYFTNGKTWRTMENDANPDWSLDEKISTCAFFSFNNDKKWLNKIPLFTKDISHYRPDVFAFVLGSKYKWLRFFLYPLVKFKMTTSMHEFSVNPIGESSGAQLAFIKASGWGDTEFIDKNEWQPVFASYYPQKEHPINRLWE